MYQSIFYNYKNKTIHLRDDNKGWFEIPHQPTYYRRVYDQQEGAYPVLTGGWAVPCLKYSESDDILERDINPELYTLRELYYKEEDTVPKWHNTVYLDIEIEIGGALTIDFIKAASMPITSIALIDSTTKTKICFIVDKSKEIKEINEDGKHIIPCISEKELISKFLDKFEELDPTIVVGYNSEFFDIPYLYFRMSSVVGKDQAKRLSPLGVVQVQDWNPKVLSVRLAGINHLDYMLLHKKYIMKEEPSYKLGAIGEKYVKLGKIEYEGNLNQLFQKDKNLFIDYNLRDVEILEKLEEKLKFIELTILISHICNTPYDQIYYNTVLGEGAILKYLKRKNIVSPNKPTTHNPGLKGKEETYAGGYLLEPIPGLYFDVIDLDFTSLYPSIIKSLNLGVETLVGRIKVFDKPNYEQNHSLEKLKERDPEEEIIIERLNKIDYTLKSTKAKLKNVIEIIEENKYTISASGAIFKTDVRSVAATVLEGWFEKREHYRELKKQAGKKQDWDNFKLYDAFQLAFKILQNALYGTYAKNIWRYTDGCMICSAAITNTGQTLTRNTIKFVNSTLNKEIPSKKSFVIISDTDSLYIELKDLIKNKYGEILDAEEKNKKILEIAADIQYKANDNLKDLVKNLFNISENKYFQLKQEVIASSILATGKRRYGMWVTNKEGVPIPADHKDALDLKGLEVMKSNMNPLFKKFGEQFIKNILFGKSKDKLDQSIIDFYKSIKTIDPKVLGKPTGVSFIDKCIKRKASVGEIFSELNINTKENSRAAIHYNDLLKFKKLDKKYESVIEGDKIFIANLIENPFKISVIGFPNADMPDEINNFINKYIDREAIFESILLNKLKELYKDLGWEFVNLNPNISKFFKF
jgi:DNA polymerase elongation subunit (family B)